MEFIYSNINWSSLPKHEDKAIEVIVGFSGSEKGTVDSVQIFNNYDSPFNQEAIQKVSNGYDSIFDQEAIRVVKTIPEWDVFYRHGKLVWTPRMLSIVFNKENEEKYRK
jgi:hypothetical protein